ncbi:3-oxoacyl-[acyl-carrier-protein] synthase III C-terminal domain-containing protein [Lysobacter xanthus]
MSPSPVPPVPPARTAPHRPLDWRVRVAGVGTYLPRRRVDSAEIEARAGLPPGWALAHSGVATRHWADAEERATWMGARAALQACEDAGVDPATLDLILNASGSVERAIPDGGPLLQHEMGLGTSGIASLSVHATCLSFLAAVEVAAERIHHGRIDRALVVSSEVASGALDFTSPEVCTLFGDGAAAWVLERAGEDDTGRVHAVGWITEGAHHDLTTVRGCGTYRHPHGPDTEHRDALFQMRGSATLRRASRLVAPLLAKVGLGAADARDAVRWIAPHQTSRAGMGFARAMGFDRAHVVDILEGTGNCIAASIPLAFAHGVRDGAIRRGERGMLVGTGAGLSAAAIVMTY